MISNRNSSYHKSESRSVSCQGGFIFPHNVSFKLWAASILLLASALVPSFAREKKDAIQYGAGLIVNIPLPQPEVEQVVGEVAENTIIRGTKEYNKDEFVSGAIAVTSTPEFPAWKEGGKVFYKIRKQALDPLNFKNSGDLGTLAVRYIVQPQGETNTVLRIDAVFVEDFRRVAHASNGSVEGSEYKDIQDRLGAVELMRKETAEALEAKESRATKRNTDAASATVTLSTPPPTTSQASETPNSVGNDTVRNTAGPAPEIAPKASPAPRSSAPLSNDRPQPAAYERQSGQSLEQHVADLRREVERLVKKPGAPLQSAPFHTATTLQSLAPGAEVLVLISTPYWYGVETRDGQHGWIRRDQLEFVP